MLKKLFLHLLRATYNAGFACFAVQMAIALAFLVLSGFQASHADFVACNRSQYAVCCYLVLSLLSYGIGALAYEVRQEISR